MMNLLNTTRITVRLAIVGTALGGTMVLALPRFGDWGTPVNAEASPQSSPALNTPAVDGCVSLSRDGLSLAFNSNRAGNQDIYLARRESTKLGFGTPERLPFPINTSADEFCPTLVMGNQIYFSRNRTGDPGDLFVSHEGPDGWDDPEPLGPGINTALMEESAAFYEDDAGNTVMLFSRREASGADGNIFTSIAGADAVPLGGGTNSAASDNRPSITHDGRTIFFDSTRTGTLGGPDLWYATRESTSVPFGSAVHLGELNSPDFDARPSISWDGTELLFSSNRTGSESPAPDIWRSARSKSRSGPKEITF